MNYLRLIILGFFMLMSVGCARNTTYYLSISDALKSPEAARVLDPSVELYFGEPAPGQVVVKDAVSNRKTNASNKSDQEACLWVFLSAVKTFQERAKKEGASKVGNLVSYYKKNEYKSQKSYECHAGTIVAGVALKGDIVK